MSEEIKLTHFSQGGGCGCKIAPDTLQQILQTSIIAPEDENLLVGNNSSDDAAVYQRADGTCVVSTTDFFMPIVDDPFEFGRIAAANAISDIYAMGGSPLMAIAILGWPIDQLSADTAQTVLEGGRRTCADAGISIAGGHSIHSQEPIFGLAVTGEVSKQHLKKNDSAQAGDRLFLSKPIGVGVLTTAAKRGLCKPEHHQLAIKSMMQLNAVGANLGSIAGVSAMTDVTGFGLLGHLLEMCQGSHVNASINLHAVPLLNKAVKDYIDQGCAPGGSQRNWRSVSHHISTLSPQQQALLCDPQTSGGLLIAVRPEAEAKVTQVLSAAGCHAEVVGQLHPVKSGEPTIEVIR